MSDSSRRIALAVNMLETLLSTQNTFDSIKVQIESACKNIASKVHDRNMPELLKYKSEFEGNARHIEKLNAEAVKTMNSWHEWSNDLKNTCSVLFPAKYYFKKKKIKKFLAHLNRKIFRAAIDNRLIREKMTAWGVDVRRQTESEIKESGLYKNLLELQNEQKLLIEDLAYLLSTLQEFRSTVIDLKDFSQVRPLLARLNSSINLPSAESI